MGTQKHQSTRIGGFKCQIRIFPSDLNIVQGFFEVYEVGNSPDLFVLNSLAVLPEILVSGLLEALLFPGLPFPDCTSKS